MTGILHLWKPPHTYTHPGQGNTILCQVTNHIQEYANQTGKYIFHESRATNSGALNLIKRFENGYSFKCIADYFGKESHIYIKIYKPESN